MCVRVCVWRKLLPPSPLSYSRSGLFRMCNTLRGDSCRDRGTTTPGQFYSLLLLLYGRSASDSSSEDGTCSPGSSEWGRDSAAAAGCIAWRTPDPPPKEYPDPRAPRESSSVQRGRDSIMTVRWWSVIVVRYRTVFVIQGKKDKGIVVLGPEI